MSDYIAADEEQDAMRRAREKLAKSQQKGVSARKNREKKIRATVDGRSLAATGRIEQLNIRVRGDIKKLVVASAAERGCTMAELMELIILDALGEQSQ